MKERFQRFMQGRYGMDAYNRFLMIAALVLMFFGIFSSAFLLVCIVILAYAYFRMFSRNPHKRAAENYAFSGIQQSVCAWFARKKQRFSDRKHYRFYHCPQCKQSLRIPRGHGKVEIKCPKCGVTFVAKS